MKVSFHPRGRDEERGQDWDSVRASLDHLKVLGEEEFGVPAKAVEEEDDAASVEAQSHKEEGAFFRELKEGDEADTEALRKADELTMDPVSDPAKRNPQVSSCYLEGSSQPANSCRSTWARLQVRHSISYCLRKIRSSRTSRTSDMFPAHDPQAGILIHPQQAGVLVHPP